jgi:hypothetical protein
MRAASSHSASPRAKADARRLARGAKVKMLCRARIRQPGPGRKPITAPEILLYRYPKNLIRDTLAPSFETVWVPIPARLRNRTVHQQPLREFSFKRNPTGTLGQLAALALASAKAAEIRLHFIDRECDDIAPYVVLAKLRQGMPPIISGGSIVEEVHEVIDAVGLKRSLRITNLTKDLPDQTSVVAFPMYSRVPPGAFGDQEHLLRPQYKEKIADRFCDTLNEWLRMHGLELTLAAESKIVASFGEGLDNAERHGDLEGEPGTGDWSVAGFGRLWEDDAGNQTLECSVAMVSIGTTISESLRTSDAAVQARIEEYTSRHSGLFSSRSDRDLLRTVMAIQDGVTRVQAATQAGRGGVGLLELINAFADLGENEDEASQSIVTIISGDSCVRITGPYRTGHAPSGSQLRELWFNERNEPTNPPDRKHVFSLQERFPGTILSACFTIDPTYLRQKMAK